jgi:hypothetical protein
MNENIISEKSFKFAIRVVNLYKYLTGCNAARILKTSKESNRKANHD